MRQSLRRWLSCLRCCLLSMAFLTISDPAILDADRPGCRPWNPRVTTARRPRRPPPFAPLAGTREAAVCIVGGGFAGLNTALGLAERGQRDVVLLDAQEVAHGASGRNGGFVFGGFSRGEAQLLQDLGPERAPALYRGTQDAVGLIRRRIAQHHIPCQATDAGVLWANWFRDPAPLRERQALLAKHFGVEWDWVPRAAAGRTGPHDALRRRPVRAQRAALQPAGVRARAGGRGGGAGRGDPRTFAGHVAAARRAGLARAHARRRRAGARGGAGLRRLPGGPAPRRGRRRAAHRHLRDGDRTAGRAHGRGAGHARGDLRQPLRVRLLPAAAGHAPAVGRPHFGARPRARAGGAPAAPGHAARVPAAGRRAHRIGVVGPDELCPP